MRTMEGNYSDYMAEKQQRALLQAQQQAPAEHTDDARRQERVAQREVRRRTQQLAELEADIERLEVELNTVTRLLDLASARKTRRASRVRPRVSAIRGPVGEQLQAWEYLAGIHHGER